MFYLFIIFGIISGALGYIFIDKMENMSNLANLIKMKNFTNKEIEVSEKNYLRKVIDSENSAKSEDKNSIVIKSYLLRREIANHIDF